MLCAVVRRRESFRRCQPWVTFGNRVKRVTTGAKAAMSVSLNWTKEEVKKVCLCALGAGNPVTSLISHISDYSKVSFLSFKQCLQNGRGLLTGSAVWRTWTPLLRKPIQFELLFTLWSDALGNTDPCCGRSIESCYINKRDSIALNKNANILEANEINRLATFCL